MAGADVANVCSVLLKEGIDKITELLDGVTRRLDEKGHSSLEELKGNLSLQSYVEPWAFERTTSASRGYHLRRTRPVTIPCIPHPRQASVRSASLLTCRLGCELPGGYQRT